MKKIYDISIRINERTIIYPCNEKVNIHQYSSILKNAVNESWIKFGLHTGTHIDAPQHVDNNSKFASKIPLESLIGNVKVIDLT